jgi:hypothetical protein
MRKKSWGVRAHTLGGPAVRKPDSDAHIGPSRTFDAFVSDVHLYFGIFNLPVDAKLYCSVVGNSIQFKFS